MVPTDPRYRIPPLDSLRGIAVLLVMMFHFHLFGAAPPLSGWSQAYAAIAGAGWIGVELFFVLSGFLITRILLNSRSHQHYYRSFYFRRLVRIFPLYYSYLLAALVLIPYLSGRLGIIGLFSPMGSSTHILAWLYLLNWQMSLQPAAAVSIAIQHLWSLSIEEQFYLVWPLIVRMGTRVTLRRICIALLPICLMLRGLFHWLELPGAAYWLTVCRLDALGTGAFLAAASEDHGLWMRVQRLRIPAGIVGLSGLVFAAVIAGSAGFGSIWMDTIGLTAADILFGSCVILALRSSNPTWPGGMGVFLQFLGKYSYALYVFHQPASHALARLGLNEAGLTARFNSPVLSVALFNAIYFAVALAASLISWHVLEKRFLTLKGRSVGQAA